MRTIKETMFERMVAQALEAETQGLSKVADSLTNQIDKYSNNVRADNSFYVYSSEEIKRELEGKLWDAVIRIADFYDGKFDAAQMQSLSEKFAQDLIDDVRTKLGIQHGVGAYESPVPGELMERTVIELEDEEV